MELVAGAGGRAGGEAIASQGQIQALAVLAHPADLTGGDAGHEGVGFDVLDDDGAGGDEDIFAQGDATDEGGVSTDSCAALDPGAAVFILTDDGGAGVVDVGEDHAGAAEDVVFQGDGVVNTDVVLHLAVVADDHVVADEDVLAEGTALANVRAGADMDPVPDAGALPYLGAGVDDGGGVSGVGHDSGRSAQPLAGGVIITLESLGDGVADAMDDLDGGTGLIKAIAMAAEDVLVTGGVQVGEALGKLDCLTINADGAIGALPLGALGLRQVLWVDGEEPAHARLRQCQ